MSLNKFTSPEIGAQIGLTMGAETLTCTTMTCQTHSSGDIDTNKIKMYTVDNKEIDIEFQNVGLPGHVLHTDGQDPANVYWGPDVGTANGIAYAGAGTQIGRHLKSNSADGLTADNSIIIEDIGAGTLDVGLRVVNCSDPVDAQDLTTKTYVDENAVIVENRKQFSTGLLSGGVISINVDTTKFDVSAGTGIQVDPTTGTETPVSWLAQTAIPIIGGQKTTHISIDFLGNVQKYTEPLPPNLQRQEIYLGDAHTPDGINIESVDNQPNVVLNGVNSLFDLGNALNHLNLSGNDVSYLSGLSIQKSQGTAFGLGVNFENDNGNPNVIDLPSLNSIADGLRYYMKNCTSSSSLTTINPNGLDTGGNYPGSSITNGYWTVQRVYSSCSSENRLNLMLGQFEYASKDDAINSINSEGFDDTTCAVINKDCLIGLIVVQKGTIDLDPFSGAEFLPVDKYGYSTKIDLSQIKADIQTNATDNTGTVTVHSDVSSAGSGQIITSLERTAIGDNTTANSGTVTVHSDVSSAGSGQIITSLERTAIGDNTTANSGTVTVHSDVSSAGSGQIITSLERTAIGDNTTAITTKVSKAGDTMTGNLNLTGSAVYQQDGLNARLALIRETSNLCTEGSGGNITVGASRNKCFGDKNFSQLSTANDNLAVGEAILDKITTQNLNIGIGNYAQQNQIGTYNVAVGTYSMAGYGAPPTANTHNVGLGISALQNLVSGSSNIALGGNSLQNIDSGSSNVAVGRQAGDTITTGSSNVFVGHQADGPATTSNSIVLGANGVATANNQCVIHNVNQIVSGGDNTCDLGSSTKQFKDLHLGGVIKEDAVNAYLPLQKGSTQNIICGGGGTSVSGVNNCAFGTIALNSVVGGSANTAINTYALGNLTTGTGNIGIGPSAGGLLIGGPDITTESNNILIGNNTRGIGFSDSIVLGALGQSSASNQCTIHNVTQIVSGSDNTCDLGSTTRQMKDLYLGGLINGLGVIGNIFTQTATSPDHTVQTTPTSILSTGIGNLSIPANSLVAGSSLRFKLGGIMSCGNGDNLTFTFLGYTTPLITCDGATTDGSYELECEIVVRGVGVTASTAINWNFAYYNDSGDLVGTAYDNTLTTIDTTAVNVFDIVCVLVDTPMKINTTMLILDKSR